MTNGFIYIWHDRQRSMFYIGSHIGAPDDGYLSSSRWLNGEITFRPKDFRRKIIKFVDVENLRLEENRYLKMIKSGEHGRKYYNIKTGKPLGTPPWCLGKTLSDETKAKISKAKKGGSTWNKGVHNPLSAENARRGAVKLALKATGRKRKYNEDGSWTWSYRAHEPISSIE